MSRGIGFTRQGNERSVFLLAFFSVVFDSGVVTAPRHFHIDFQLITRTQSFDIPWSGRKVLCGGLILAGIAIARVSRTDKGNSIAGYKRHD